MFRRHLAVLALAVFTAVMHSGTLTRAAEVLFRAPGAPQALADDLSASSLSVQASGKNDISAQDVLAAAQADYGRLTGVLYAAGYYGGVISIRVDGREAAMIPPLSTPRRIDRIDVTVEPGPPFGFHRRALRRWPPEPGCPKGFAAAAWPEAI